jgi:hypothetical protein
VDLVTERRDATEYLVAEHTVLEGVVALPDV